MRVLGKGVFNHLGQVDVLLGVFGDEVGEQSQHIVKDLHLPVAAGPGSDADGGNGQPLGNELRQRRRHQFQDHRVGPGRFQGQGVGQQLGCLSGVAPAHPVAAQGVDRLGSYPDMAHNRDVALDDALHNRGHVLAALQLDRVGAAFLHQAGGVG